MHVTNATTQMQAFNAPIWLGLEDYALEHARQNAMQISVFTGLYFSLRDHVWSAYSAGVLEGDSLYSQGLSEFNRS